MCRGFFSSSTFCKLDSFLQGSLEEREKQTEVAGKFVDDSTAARFRGFLKKIKFYQKIFLLDKSSKGTHCS
jgi:hypothetical protein